jgi:hypothetical protein
MTAKYAPVSMDFIHDDEMQIRKQIAPRCMLGQYAGVKHIWIGDENPLRPSNLPALALRCIAVITVDLNR